MRLVIFAHVKKKNIKHSLQKHSYSNLLKIFQPREGKFLD